MAGTLRINDNAVWMPAGWIYDGILDLIAAQVANEDPALAETLRKARTEATGYHNLRTLDKDSFLLLLRGTERAYAKALSQGAQAFHDRSMYPSFIKHFDTLRGSLKADPRAAGGG
jgi:hypothetical protein